MRMSLQKAVINNAAIEEAYKYCDYNMLVTSETDMDTPSLYRKPIPFLEKK